MVSSMIEKLKPRFSDAGTEDERRLDGHEQRCRSPFATSATNPQIAVNRAMADDRKKISKWRSLMTEHFTFADSETGLTHALHVTCSLRRAGFKTRLATRRLPHGFVVHTVVPTPRPRATRKDRCSGFSAPVLEAAFHECAGPDPEPTCFNRQDPLAPGSTETAPSVGKNFRTSPEQSLPRFMDAAASGSGEVQTHVFDYLAP